MGGLRGGGYRCREGNKDKTEQRNTKLKNEEREEEERKGTR